MPSAGIWADWLGLFLTGLVATLEITVVTFVLTVIVAWILSILAVSEIRGVRWAARGWIELFRSIPVLALLILLYFGLGGALNAIGVHAFALAVVALVASCSAYLAEVYRGWISSTPPSQWNAAKSLGMSHWETMRSVIIPQILPPLVPSTLNSLISVIKYSSLASLISVAELTLQAQKAVSLSFYPLQAYLLLGAFYAAIIIPLIYIVHWVERMTKRRFGVDGPKAVAPSSDIYALVDDLEQRERTM